MCRLNHRPLSLGLGLLFPQSSGMSHSIITFLYTKQCIYLNKLSSIPSLHDAIDILTTNCLAKTSNPKKKEKYSQLQDKIGLEIKQRAEEAYKLVKMLMKKADKLIEKTKLMQNYQQIEKEMVIDKNETY